MRTHFEPVEGSQCLVYEVIDKRNTFECSKGHKWEETLEIRFSNLPLPINFPIPNGDAICPFCLSELLTNVGRVKITEV